MTPRKHPAREGNNVQVQARRRRRRYAGKQTRETHTRAKMSAAAAKKTHGARDGADANPSSRTRGARLQFLCSSLRPGRSGHRYAMRNPRLRNGARRETSGADKVCEKSDLSLADNAKKPNLPASSPATFSRGAAHSCRRPPVPKIEPRSSHGASLVSGLPSEEKKKKDTPPPPTRE